MTRTTTKSPPAQLFTRRGALALLGRGAGTITVLSLCTLSASRGAWAAVSPAAPLSDGAPNALKALLTQFQKCPGISAHFEEEKKIALLAAPLRSSGDVYFHPPHSLARIVEKPRSSHLVITDRRIIVKDSEGRREVDLSDKAALKGLVSSLLHVLAGDEARLLQDYHAEFEKKGESAWRLSLTPKKEELKKMVLGFTLEGEGVVLSQLVVKEASGDESLTRFSSVRTDRQFSKAEIANFFGI